MSGTSFRWIIGERGHRKGYEQSGVVWIGKRTRLS